MNITLSVDKTVLAKARKVARGMGKSINELVREYLAQVAGQASIEEEIQEFVDLSKKANGHSKGWKFNRNEIHERS